MDDPTIALAEQLPPPPPSSENSTVPDSAIFNESNPTENTPAQASFVEKINASAGEILEKYGVKWRRGRGRPRIDGEPKKSDIPLNVPATATPVSSVAPATNGAGARDSLIIRRSVAAMAKALTSSFDKALFRRAKAVTGDEAFAREVVNATAATSQECEALAEVTDILMAELGLQSKYLPLAASLTIVGGCALRYRNAFKDLSIVEQKKNPPLKP